MGTLPAWISVYRVYDQYTESPEEGFGFPGTEFTNGFKLPCGCWESNQGLLQEQPVLLTATELSLQPPDFTLLLWPSEPHAFIYLSSLFLNTVSCKYGEVGACS